MKDLGFTVVDAFTDRAFAGNPAAVMVLDDFLPDTELAQLAAEHAYAETAFLVRTGPRGYRLRWFTPTVEVPLCGHATLASAHALMTEHGEEGPLRFETRSGPLSVYREESGYRLDFPCNRLRPIPADPRIAEALGAEPEAVLGGAFTVAVLDSEDAVRSLEPDMAAVARIEADEIVATAPGGRTDFVSRMFGPRIGIPEDPFTGAAHTALTPYWAGRLGKDRLTAHQASRRGGDAVCQLSGERVFLFGNAVTTMRGQMVL